MNGFQEEYDSIFASRISRYLNDPVGMKTEWTYIGAQGENFNGYIYKRTDNKIIISMSNANKVMFLCVYFFSFIILGFPFSNNLEFSFAISAIFIIIALLLLYGATYKLLKICNKTFFANTRILEIKTIFKKTIFQISFKEIHAIQIIPVLRSSADCGYNITFEINLVTQKANRIFLAEFCNQINAQRTAKDLVAFLEGGEVWDITC